MSVSGNAAEPTQQIMAHFAPDPPERLGVAVSGGSDSLGLLVLLQDWRAAGGPALEAVTVDHGLRPEAHEEVVQVAEICRGYDIPHTVLDWRWDGQGNLPDAARRGRYAAMAGWARDRGIAAIALGHTQDDLAETFLMRLARDAGLDGLAAMTPAWQQGGVWFHRPALDLSRAALRAVVQGRGLSWVEDASNADPRYARTRARGALAALAQIGISAKGIAQSARHLAEARQALAWAAAEAAERVVRVDAGDLLLEADAYRALPREIQRRLMRAGLAWIGGEGYAPRGSALTRLIAGEEATLQGCRLIAQKDQLRLTREFGAVADLRAPVGALWDGRWHLTGPAATDGLDVAALGEAGLALCPERKATGRPAASLMASPAVWRGADLVAAPLAGLPNGWSAAISQNNNSVTDILRRFAQNQIL